MTSAAAIQNDTVWLETKNYHLVPLKGALARHLPELDRALQTGAAAYPDPSRQNFYDLKLRSGWCYVHIHDEARTVYLVAFAAN